MNLWTIKMVTFLLLMEEGAGVMAKEPQEILNTYDAVNSFTSPEQLRSYLGPERVHKLENYLRIWIKPLQTQGPPEFPPVEIKPPGNGGQPTPNTDTQEAEHVPDNST